jgi:hypothetical protein
MKNAIRIENQKIETNKQRIEWNQKRLDQELSAKRFNAWTVKGQAWAKGKGLEGTTVHEFGHVLHDQIFGGINSPDNRKYKYNIRVTQSVLSEQDAKALRKEWKSLYRKERKKDWVFSDLSKYGVSDDKEFFAESFTLYNFRPDLLPDNVRSIFDKYWPIMDQARAADKTLK